MYLVIEAPLCLGTWLWPVKKNKLLTSLWQEVVLQLGEMLPPKLGSYVRTDTGRQGLYLLWQRKSVSLTSERAPGSLRKIFLGQKAKESPAQFSAGFLYISRTGESTYKFAEVNVLKKSLLIFSTGRIKPLNFFFVLTPYRFSVVTKMQTLFQKTPGPWKSSQEKIKTRKNKTKWFRYHAISTN